MVGSLGEDVVRVVKRVLDDQGAQHAFREGEMRAIDARAALCGCQGVSMRYTTTDGSRTYRRRCGPCSKTHPR